MKFHEEIDQLIEQFEGQIIGQHFQYLLKTKTRKNAIVKYLDYQIPVTQLKEQKGNGNTQAATRD